MQYMGGKHRLARRIVSVLLKVAEQNKCTRYIEPFCGACSVIARIPTTMERIARDGNKDLILLLRKMRSDPDWLPKFVDKPRWEAMKSEEPSAQRGFTAFAQSFGGAFFNGFSNEDLQNRPRWGVALRGLREKLATMRDVIFVHGDYRDVQASASVRPGHGVLIYCDPPYRGVRSYKGSTFAFDSDEFWLWAQKQAEAGAMVVVSEMQAPAGWREIAAWPTRRVISKTGRSTVVEKLFMWGE